MELVANGLEAVPAERQRLSAGVLMGYQLPGIDGYEVSTAIRQGELEGRRTPTIAMAASAMDAR